METLTEQPQSPEMCDETHNGSVMVDDLDHIQKVNRDLEQQLSDKNRVRQLHVPPAFNQMSIPVPRDCV